MTLGVTNSHRGVIEWFLERFAGSAYEEPVKREAHHSRTWVWKAGGRDAASLLQQALPYLIVKAPEADVAIAFQEHMRREGRPGRPVSEEDQQARRYYHDLLREVRAAYHKESDLVLRLGHTRRPHRRLVAPSMAEKERRERDRLILRLRRDGHTIYEIARQAGWSAQVVCEVLNANGMPRLKNTPAQLEHIRDMVRDREDRRRRGELVTGSPRSRWRTREQVLAAFAAWELDRGHLPTAGEWRRGTDRHPPTSRVIGLFGTWGTAIIAAGGTPNYRRFRPEAQCDPLGR